MCKTKFLMARLFFLLAQVVLLSWGMVMTSCSSSSPDEVEMAARLADDHPQLALELLRVAQPRMAEADTAALSRFSLIADRALRSAACQEAADSLEIILQKEDGQYADALAYAVEALRQQPHMRYAAAAQPTRKGDLKETTAKTSQEEKDSQSRDLLLGGLFVFLLIAASGIAFQIYDRRKNLIIQEQRSAFRRQQRDFEIHRDNLEMLIESMGGEVEQLRGRLRLAEERRDELTRAMEAINRQRQETLERGDDTLRHYRLVAARAGSMDEEDWTTLLNLADARRPDFQGKIKAAYPKCDTSALRLCALTILGFDNNEIGALMDTYRQKLYKMRTRVSRHIARQGVGNADEFALLLEDYLRA